MDTATIAAVATAPGRGGIGVVRLSGPTALAIAEGLCRQALKPRYARLCDFHAGEDDQTILDQGLAIYFPGPHSFTGEDVVELQAHGAPVVLDLLLRYCCTKGARLARPGEFSERAFLNGKLDLTQAEAIADLIAADSAAAARNAMRSLQGAFSREIEQLQTQLTALRVYVEAAIDFPDEDIEWLGDGSVGRRLDELIAQVAAVRCEAERGVTLQEGLQLVIMGAPNAGKSSLLNALTGSDTAIVTAIAGTTRDILRQQIQVEGLVLHVSDTAGLRQTDDPVEKEGVRRARQAIADADLILHVVDASCLTASENPAGNPTLLPGAATEDTPVITILNKCDLIPDASAALELHQNLFSVVQLSALTGEGLDLLRQEILRAAGLASGEGRFSARRRHLMALDRAAEHLDTASLQLQAAAPTELIAEDLRLCQHVLAEITGGISADALLGEIFAGFCIGK